MGITKMASDRLATVEGFKFKNFNRLNAAEILTRRVQGKDFFVYSKNPYVRTLNFQGQACCLFLSRDYDFKYQAVKFLIY